MYGVGVVMLAALLFGAPLPPIVWLMFATAVVLSAYIRLYEEQRWQQATRLTRLVRYCWFRPLRLIQFGWWVLKWAAGGLQPLVYPADPVILNPGNCGSLAAKH